MKIDTNDFLLLFLVILAFLAFILYRCLDKFIHSEEKMRDEQGGEHKMMMPVNVQKWF